MRIALVVHGFQSDTWGMVGRLSSFFTETGIAYDHLLTFDYETFGTGVRKNAQILATELRRLNFGADDERSLDVFAHSMGTLVIRFVGLLTLAVAAMALIWSR